MSTKAANLIAEITNSLLTAVRDAAKEYHGTVTKATDKSVVVAFDTEFNGRHFVKSPELFKVIDQYGASLQYTDYFTVTVLEA